MELLLKFILASAGLTWVLGKSKLFKSFREYLSLNDQLFNDILLKTKSGKTFFNKIAGKLFWFFSEMFSCSGCLGAWCGLLVSIAMFHRFDIMYMFIGSITALLLIEKK